MTKLPSSLGIVAVALALNLQAPSAEAQLARTYVSSGGSDTNNCDRATPCRTFQRAHDNTLASGEITVLNPGGYGAVTITKNISIINDGVGEAGVLVSGGGNGITINAGAGDAVSLRGLTIKGIGYGGGTGIVFQNGKSLTVENCAIRNMTHVDTPSTGYGLWFVPGGSSSLTVTSTLIAENSSYGILVQPVGSGSVGVVLNRVGIHNNGFAGLDLLGSNSTGTVKAMVKDSVVASNDQGVRVESAPTYAATSLMLIRSVVANNDTGFFLWSANAVARFGQSTVTGNTTGWKVYGGNLLFSYGDNRIDGNGGYIGPALARVFKK
jgi:hypothetical protein